MSMKKFSRADSQRNIFSHIIPAGAFYGRVDLSYDRKIRGEAYEVKDKNGRTIFNNDGTIKTAYKYKTIKERRTVFYSVESFSLYKDNKGNKWLRAWLLCPNDKSWHEEVLGSSAFTRELNAYIMRHIKTYCENNGENLETLECDEARVKSKNNYVPARREVQKDYILRGRPGYATNPFVMSEDIKPKAPITSSNIKKARPEKSDKPIYHSPQKTTTQKKDPVHHIIRHDVYEDGTPFTVII